MTVLRNSRLVDFGCLAAGASVPFAFAPFGWWWLAVFAPSVLIVSWLNVEPKRAFWRGWLFGCGMFGIGVSWVQVSVHQFGLPVLAFSLSITIAFVALLALYPAVLGALWCRFLRGSITEKVNIYALLAVAPGWVLTEWLRGWLVLGFPWLALGYSQLATPMAGLAPVFGVFGVSAAVMLSAALLAGLYVLRGKARISAMVSLLVIWGSATLLAEYKWGRPTGASVSVAMIQGNVPQALKWLPQQRQPTLDLYRDLSEAHWGKGLIVWPETAIPAFPRHVLPFIAALAERGKRSGTTLLSGILTNDGQQHYNSLLAIGAVPQQYRKHRLVPFGEYLPAAVALRPILDRLGVAVSEFSRGPKLQAPMEVAGHSIGTSICYEAVFSEEIIRPLPDAAWLVNVSNDAWFGDSLAPRQHLEIAQMRSLETARYMMRSTNTGISAVIDARGKIIAESPQFETDVLVAEVQPMAGATPFVIVGNWLIVSLCVVAVLLVGFGPVRLAKVGIQSNNGRVSGP